MMQRAYPYCPSVRPFSSQDVPFEAGRENSFPAEVFGSLTDISPFPGYEDERTCRDRLRHD